MKDCPCPYEKLIQGRIYDEDDYLDEDEQEHEEEEDEPLSLRSLGMNIKMF